MEKVKSRAYGEETYRYHRSCLEQILAEPGRFESLVDLANEIRVEVEYWDKREGRGRKREAERVRLREWR